MTDHGAKNEYPHMHMIKKIVSGIAVGLKISYLACHEFRRRLYSTTIYRIFKRDLSVQPDNTSHPANLFLRPLDAADIPKLLNIYEEGLSAPQILERIRLLFMIRSGIHTPYVVVTEEDVPCHIAWLIDHRDNEKIRSYFKKRIPPLQPDEVLFEFVFTLENYRNRGIQNWRIRKFISISVARGARTAFTFIKDSNQASINNVLKNGFQLYQTRTDRWRFFRCFSHFEFPKSTS